MIKMSYEDNDVYRIRSEECGNLTIRKVYSHNLCDGTFAHKASSHNIFDGNDWITIEDEDDEPVEKFPYFTDAIVFQPYCEFTGIHYHHLKIFIIKDSKIVSKLKHSAVDDGSLSKPSYEAFLVTKLKKLEKEYLNIPIYIHENLLKYETFYDEMLCCKNQDFFEIKNNI